MLLCFLTLGVSFGQRRRSCDSGVSSLAARHRPSTFMGTSKQVQRGLAGTGHSAACRMRIEAEVIM